MVRQRRWYDAATKALVGANVIDGTSAAVAPDAVILNEGGRILSLGPRASAAIPEGFERKNLAGLTVLPGLIDSHVHISFALPHGPNDPQAEATIDAVCRDFLRCGVTTIRDVGAGYPWIIDLARSIEEGRRNGRVSQTVWRQPLPESPRTSHAST